MSTSTRRRRSRPSESHPPALRWALEYLPDYFTDQPAPFHAELLRDLSDPAKRLIARVAPRGHAKSTCAALAYPLWCICEQRKRNIVIITHESSLATQFVRDIRNELETNELILAAYGDLCRPADQGDTDDRKRTTRRRSARRAKWSEAIFTTATHVTVQAKGTGASLRGVRVGPQRPDLIICDDLEKDELVATEEGRRKLEHWLRRVVMPALAPDGQLLVLGSLIHHDALLARLADRKRFPRWDYRVYRAIEARARDDGLFDRVPLWPARWPLERLDEERQRIGTIAFEQEYQANPIDTSLQVFRPEWLRRYDPRELENRELITLMAVDPATGTTGGDFFALWVGSVDCRSGVIYTRQLSLERIGIVAQIKRIVAAFHQWRPVRIGIETVAYQAALKQILEEHGARDGVYLPIVAIRTTSNKRARIEGSAPFFENGLFRLPPTLDEEVEKQFLQFPKARHDDAPDVCAMGIELAREFRSLGRIEARTAGRGPFGRHDW